MTGRTRPATRAGAPAGFRLAVGTGAERRDAAPAEVALA